MGCANSKEEEVQRCRSRKRLMKQVVAHRHDFALAHTAYLLSLKNTGAALRQFAEGEEGKDVVLTLPPPLQEEEEQQQLSSLPEPPPPFPLNSSPIRITRDSSAKNPPKASPILQEYDDHSMNESTSPFGTPPPPSPPRDSAWYFLNPFRPSSPPCERDQGRIGRSREHGLTRLYEDEGVPDLEHVVSDHEGYAEGQLNRVALVEWARENTSLALVVRRAGSKTLGEVVKKLDDQFLKAFQGGQDVSRLLEARKGDVTANSPGQNNNQLSGRVLSAFSWNWSRITRGGMSVNREDTEGLAGSHAVTLERLLAWERKLLEEVKNVVALRSEHQKKCDVLRHQEAKAEDKHTIEKTRGQIKRLYSEILVSFQGVDSTTAAIQSLRDDELYPQLVQLVEALANMWRMMYASHVQQKQIVLHLKNLDALLKHTPTSDFHHKSTIQLEKVLGNWYDCFLKLVNSHREYVATLNGWLRLTLIPIETEPQNIQEREVDELESPQKSPSPKITGLCKEWQQAVDGMPDKVASEAIKSLIAVVHAMVEQQCQEMRQKQKAENVARQLERKISTLESFEKKCREASIATKTPATRSSGEEREVEEEEEGGEIWGGEESSDGEGRAEAAGEDVLRAMSIARDPVGDRRAAVDAFKRVVENEQMKHCKYVKDTRVLTMNNLQSGLPGVYEAMTGFSAVCVQSFESMWKNHDVRT